MPMYSLTMLCCCIGFFHLYNTSAKAKLSALGIYEIYLQSHPQIAKFSGRILILLSAILLVCKDGWGLGACLFFIMVMCVACLIISLTPMGYIRWKQVLLLVAISFLLELIVFK